MKIIDVLLKVAGKENFKIDSEVSNKYIFYLAKNYGIMMIRGKLLSLGNKDISHKIFVGKKVKFIEKKKVKVGSNTKIHSGTKIDALSKDGVLIGNNVVIGKDSIIECTGSIRQVGKGLKIGNNTSFGNECFFGAAGGIEIGNDVIGGQLIRFHSENHNFKSHDKLIREQGVVHKGIKVGNNCWIGSGVVFLDGSGIGDGCVVAANSVVTKQFGNNIIIGGTPARVLKER